MESRVLRHAHFMFPILAFSFGFWLSERNAKSNVAGAVEYRTPFQRFYCASTLLQISCCRSFSMSACLLLEYTRFQSVGGTHGGVQAVR